MWRRLSPALSLFFLAPLIAEYLLGSLPMTMIVILPLMAMMYGSAAILIREFARGSGRGWPSILLLATAYGVFEEGFVTQSLFNPHYLHLRLLDYGFQPALGTGIPWLVFVISIHVLWSISVPIGLTEALFKGRRKTVWLGWPGRTIFALLLLLGSAAVAGFTHRMEQFRATPAQFGGAGIALLALVIAAFAWPSQRLVVRNGAVPPPAVLFLMSFVAGSTLQIVQQLARAAWHWPWEACAAAVLTLELVFAGFLSVTASGRVWSDSQRFALMAGGLWVYIWVGFGTDASLHGAAGLPAHAVIASIFVALCVYAGFAARGNDEAVGAVSSETGRAVSQ